MSMLKRFKSVMAGLMIPAVYLLSSAVANAQVESRPSSSVKSIVVTGNRSQQISRSVLIPTKTPVENVELYPLDVQGNEGNVFPDGAIIPQTPKAFSSTQMIVPIQFNLRQATSGEFSGNLQLSYSNGEITIPVTVRVKDHWLLPVLMLFVGTLLGIMVSVYRAQGKPRDEILVRVGKLRNQTREDPDWEKSKAFLKKVNSILIEVQIALQADNWEEAIAKVQQAENLWKKWIIGRENWLALLEYSDDILKRLESQNLETNLEIKELIRDLKDAVNQAPDEENPEQFRAKLHKIYEQVNRLFLEKNQKELNNLVTDVPEEKANEFKEKIKSLSQDFESLSRVDIKNYVSLQTQMDDLKTEIEAERAASVSDAVSKGVFGMIRFLNPVDSPPATSPSLQSQQAQEAGVRLQVFTLTSYAIAVIFLAGAGFSQLYVDNATFGANPWKDYFALMAWGFGAEATRDAITKVIQSWDLPGLK